MDAATAHGQGVSTGPEGGGQSRVGVPLAGDNRQRVVGSTNQPSRWIGQLRAWWPSGVVTAGTATLVGDRHLLTCAHNFYDTANNVWCTRALFRPALNRSATGQVLQPYPAHTVVTWHVPEDYIRHGGPPPPQQGIPRRDITSYLSDYAVGVLEKAVDDPPGRSMLAPNWPGDSKVPGLGCQIIGYSGDRDPYSRTQFTRLGTVALSDDHEYVTYRMSTYRGDSGAGVFYQPPGTPFWYNIAVHVTGVTGALNFGPAMSGEAFAWVQEKLL